MVFGACIELAYMPKNFETVHETNISSNNLMRHEKVIAIYRLPQVGGI